MFGIVRVAGSANIFALTGVRLNVVAEFMRIPVPTDEVCLTVKPSAGPLVVDGTLVNC